MNARHALLFLYLFFVSPCFAQTVSGEKPDKPQPRIADTAYLVELGAMGATWTADTISTHNSFAANPGRVEGGPFFNGSRSTTKVMAAWGTVDVGAAVAAYEWKKYVHNHYLHPLWHVFMLQRIDGHVESSVYNWTLQTPPAAVAAGCIVSKVSVCKAWY